MDETSNTGITLTENVLTDGVTLHTKVITDDQRLAALRDVSLLDTVAEESFDRLTRLATNSIDAPVALVSLVDQDRQFFKSCVGLPEPWASQRETPLSYSFCQHTVVSGQPLVIEDARQHPLVKDNLAIRDLGVVAYAGMPLRTSDGHVIGSFCVIDQKPRVWSERELAILADLAASVMSEIEMRTAAQLADRLTQEHARLRVREREALTRAETSELTLAAVIEHVPTGLVVVNTTGHVVLINEAGRRISGGPPDHRIPFAEHVRAAPGGARGTPPPNLQLVDPDTERALLPEETPIARALAGESIHECEGILRRLGNQEDVWVRMSAVPLLNATGEVSGAVAVFSDITRQRALEREKEDFLAAVSHDLKTPVTTIKGFAQLLRRRVTRTETVDRQQVIGAVDQIDSTAGRMVVLIDELMEITRIRLGETLTLHRKPTDLVALTRHVVEQYRDLAVNHRVSLTADVAPILGDWDATRVERVVANLLVNAIKYSPEGGTIALHVCREQDASESWAMVTVKDQGLGIPERDLPHVFEPLYRGSNVTETQSGTGIGLASVRQIVERHGGTITVESREGEGAAFTVRLPASEAPPVP